MAVTRCAAIEAAPHGVRVNAVAPSLAMHANLAKATSEELLEELTSREAFGRCGRAVGGRQRHRLPRLRLLELHDRRGRLRLQPARLTHSLTPFGVPGTRTARTCGAKTM